MRTHSGAKHFCNRIVGSITGLLGRECSVAVLCNARTLFLSDDPGLLGSSVARLFLEPTLMAKAMATESRPRSCHVSGPGGRGPGIASFAFHHHQYGAHWGSSFSLSLSVSLLLHHTFTRTSHRHTYVTHTRVLVTFCIYRTGLSKSRQVSWRLGRSRQFYASLGKWADYRTSWNTEARQV